MSVCALLLSAADASAARLGIELQPSGRLGGELNQPGETDQIRIAQQYGLGYLPLMVMRQLALIEKHVSAAGLGNVHVIWNRYPSGDAMNEALRLGFLDIASGGVVPLLQLWDQTQGGMAVKGMAALSAMPLYLNTRDPNVKTLQDFTDHDRIGLPAVKTSIQAIVLQMAAARAFGDANYGRLDGLTVSMVHPDAMQALFSASSPITAHFASPPFQYQELARPNIHTVLSSEEVLGGSATFTVLWTRAQFRTLNPRTVRAVYDAAKEAVGIIAADSRLAAKIYIQQADVALAVDFVQKVLQEPGVEFTLAPRKIVTYAKFMQKTGMIGTAPTDWQDVFFPEVYVEPGS